MNTKTLLLTSLLLALPIVSRAQQEELPRHEISFDLGWGTLNGDYLEIGCHDNEKKKATTPLEQYRVLKYDLGKVKQTPSFDLQYHYHFRLWNSQFALGATLALQGESQKRKDRDYVNRPGGIDSRSSTYLNMLFSFRYYPLYRPKVKIYTGVSVGHSHYWDQDIDDASIRSHSCSVYHVTLFGISLGKKLFCFGEFGLGHLGVLRAGAGVRF